MLSPLTVVAGSFGITPLRVDLSATATTAALTVRSDGDTPTVVQAEVLAWEQQDGADRLTPTREVLVSPAVFTLQPAGSQLVRVGLRRGADPTRELSYRLILTEVPPRAGEFSGLAVALRLSLPVFVAPAAPAKADMHWNAARSPDGHLTLTARNDGLAHYRVLKLSLAPVSGTAPALEQPVTAYVLPGQSRTWVLGPVVTAQVDGAEWRRLKLTGLAADGPIETEITLAPE